MIDIDPIEIRESNLEGVEEFDFETNDEDDEDDDEDEADDEDEDDNED